MGRVPLIHRWRRGVDPPAPPAATATGRPPSRPLDPEVDTDVRRAVTRADRARPALSAEVAAVGTLLERAARHRWRVDVLGDALLRGHWPLLAPGTQPVAPDLPQRHSPAWRRALLEQLDPVWSRYLDLRSQLVATYGPAPFGDAECGRCTPSQTCDRCLAGLRAAWDLRDSAARAVLRIPAAAALAATRGAVPSPRRPATARRTSRRRS